MVTNIEDELFPYMRPAMRDMIKKEAVMSLATALCLISQQKQAVEDIAAMEAQIEKDLMLEQQNWGEWC